MSNSTNAIDTTNTANTAKTLREIARIADGDFGLQELSEAAWELAKAEEGSGLEEGEAPELGSELRRWGDAFAWEAERENMRGLSPEDVLRALKRRRGNKLREEMSRAAIDARSRLPRGASADEKLAATVAAVVPYFRVLMGLEVVEKGILLEEMKRVVRDAANRTWNSGHSREWMAEVNNSARKVLAAVEGTPVEEAVRRGLLGLFHQEAARALDAFEEAWKSYDLGLGRFLTDEVIDTCVGYRPPVDE